MSDFASQYEYGKMAETKIAQWLRGRGLAVLPVYEKVVDDKTGPRLFVDDNRSFTAPDMVTFSIAGNVLWIEAKHKEAFTWHRNTGKWTTGVDLHHFKDYCKVAEETATDVWILFFHEHGQAKDSPEGGPTGLFGNSIQVLKTKYNHKSPNWGRRGMIYWARECDGGALKEIATHAEITKGTV